MPITVDPRRFTGLSLISRASATDDYGIFIDGLRAGRIMRQPRSFGRDVWFWTVTGPMMMQAGLASNGEAETIDKARQAFRTAFDNWLAWAAAHEGTTLHWMT